MTHPHHPDQPRPYLGPWPIRSHRTCEQVRIDEQRERGILCWQEQRAYGRTPGNRMWCEQCERQVLPSEAAACTDRNCAIPCRRAA